MFKDWSWKPDSYTKSMLRRGDKKCATKKPDVKHLSADTIDRLIHQIEGHHEKDSAGNGYSERLQAD